MKPNSRKPQSTVEGYFYDEQLKKYLAHFMNIFTGLTVRTGKRDEEEYTEMAVPVTYGSKDRVAAAIASGNTQNKPIRLPAMSAYMTGMSFAPGRNAGSGTSRTVPFLKQGGIMPHDVTSIVQYRPIPYDIRIDLTIYTTNIDQHFQLLEQILIYFNPVLQIQHTDAAFDMTKITSVELESINFNENYMPGTTRRKIQSTLTFYMPVWISAPVAMRDNLTKKILTKIHTGTFEDFVLDAGDPLGEPDYDVLHDVSVLEGMNDN